MTSIVIIKQKNRHSNRCPKTYFESLFKFGYDGELLTINNKIYASLYLSEVKQNLFVKTNDKTPIEATNLSTSNSKLLSKIGNLFKIEIMQIS